MLHRRDEVRQPPWAHPELSFDWYYRCHTSVSLFDPEQRDSSQSPRSLGPAASVTGEAADLATVEVL